DFFGAGTQRVEQEVRRLFPAARTLRWDQDTVRRTSSVLASCSSFLNESTQPAGTLSMRDGAALLPVQA
ncbi:MAG: hypothetical protein ACKOWF_00230, partial [Chloroflexota bacterium]